jgi:ribosome-associated protein YbcJ (S4-like RNA binding protein)
MVASLYGFSGGGGGGTASLPDVTPTHGQVTSVPTQAETTVVSRVVPVGYAYKLRGIVVTGSAAAEWIVYDNATEVYRTRTSESERGKEILSGNAIPFVAGHTCAVKAVHTEVASQNFYGTLLGNDE